MAPRALRIYIDDSGEKEYGPSTSRYFVYAGVVVDPADEKAMCEQIVAIKTEAFGTENVEIKSNWIRQPTERKRRYLDPFGITEKKLDEAVDRFRLVMKSTHACYVAAAIDKPQMLKKYRDPWYPSATAYQFLLQRYEKHCTRLGATGLVTIDDMSGSSPKRNQWRDLLRTHHTRLKKDGCSITRMRFDSIADRLQFGASSAFHMLQVADFLAYNVFRQFRDNGDSWDKSEAGTLPVYPPLLPLVPRFMLGPEGVLEGWGIVKWPNDRKSKWRVRL